MSGGHNLHYSSAERPDKDDHAQEVREEDLDAFPNEAPVLVETFGVIWHIDANRHKEGPVDHANNSEFGLPFMVEVEVLAREPKQDYNE